MTHTSFYKLALALWGEDWRPELRKLLAAHGCPHTRRTLYNWQHGKTGVPEGVVLILKDERKRRKEIAQ